MATLRCAVPFNGIQTVNSADKTIVQLKAPANQRLRVYGFEIGASGIVPTDPPIIVKGTVQSRAGTGGTSVTPVKIEQSLSETPQATAQTGPASGAWTTDPLQGGDLIQYLERLHPQGAIPKTFYFGTEIWVAGGGYFALVLNSGSGALNTINGVLFYEE